MTLTLELPFGCLIISNFTAHVMIPRVALFDAARTGLTDMAAILIFRPVALANHWVLSDSRHPQDIDTVRTAANYPSCREETAADRKETWTSLQGLAIK